MSNKAFVRNIFFESPKKPVTDNYLECASVLSRYVYLCEGTIEENKFTDLYSAGKDKVASTVKSLVGSAISKLLTNFLSFIDPKLSELVKPFSSSSDAVWKNLQKIQNPVKLEEARKGWIKGTNGKFYTGIDKMPTGVKPSGKRYQQATPVAVPDVHDNTNTEVIPPPDANTETKPTDRINWSDDDAKNLRKQLAQSKAPASFDVDDDEWNDITTHQQKRKDAKTAAKRDTEPREIDLNDGDSRPLIIFPDRLKTQYLTKLADNNGADETKVESLYTKISNKMDSWPGLKYVPAKFRIPFALLCVTMLVIGITKLVSTGDTTDLHNLALQTNLPIDLVTPDQVANIATDPAQLAPVADIANAVPADIHSHGTTLIAKALDSVMKPTDVDPLRYENILKHLVHIGKEQGIQSVMTHIDNSPFNTPDVINYVKASM